MTKVSRRLLDDEIEQRMYEVFWETVAGLKNPEEAEKFLRDLLSPTEQIMLVKRLAIAVLLTRGYTYDDIDETLKVSRSTIMRVSYWLKHGDKGYQRVIRKILQKRKWSDFWDKIEEFLLTMSPPAKVGSTRYRVKQEAGRKLYKSRKRRSIL